MSEKKKSNLFRKLDDDVTPKTVNGGQSTEHNVWKLIEEQVLNRFLLNNVKKKLSSNYHTIVSENNK